MRTKNTKAFSFVEIVISLSIIVLLTVIGMSAHNNYKETVDNTKIVSDVTTLKNAVTNYYQQNNDLPDPHGNKNYINEDTSYAHSSSGAFAVHGFITEETFPKSAIDIIPLDPKTNQYYAFGKTYDSNEYEIAGINWDKGDPIAFVDGDYAAESGPFNLIREYNGPEFVSKGSTAHLPYNPEEQVLVAKIEDFAGIVNIISNGTTLTSNEELLSHTLRSGDNITVDAGGYAELYFSDGTVSILGDDFNSSELYMADMEFKDNDNIFTQIKLVLGGGTIWNKATNLANQSEFEIYTTDSSAAVRGTVFGVSYDSGITSITVDQGKVEVNNIISEAHQSAELLAHYIKEAPENIVKESIRDSSVTNIDYDAQEQKSYIDVSENGGIKQVSIQAPTMQGNPNYINNSTYYPQPGAVTDKVQDTIIEGKKFNKNIRSDILDYKYNDNVLKFGIEINDTIKSQADFIRMDFKDESGEIKVYAVEINDISNKNIELSNNIVYFTNESVFNLTDSGSIEDQSNSLNETLALFSSEYTPEAISIRFGKFNPLSDAINNIGDSDTNNVASSNLSFLIPQTQAENIIAGGSGTNQNIYKANYTDPVIVHLTKRTFSKATTDDGNLSVVATPNCYGFLYENINGKELCAQPDQDLKQDGWNLVAYAPYNIAGDLNIYSNTGPLGIHGSNGLDSNTTELPMGCGGLTSKENKSFCDTGKQKGLFIDSDSNDGIDHLKYDLSNLSLANNTIIEMNVRGSALNREYIFPNYYQLFNSDGIFLKRNATSTDQFDNNTFYSVVYNNSNNQVTINGVDKSILFDFDSGAVNWMYVGSGQDNGSGAKNQWDGIINYVKIYTK